MPPVLVQEPPFQNVSRQMSKMMEQLQKGYYGFMPSETWIPTVNLYETEEAYHVCFDLAGVDKEKIDLVVHEQRLTLRGHRAVPHCEKTLPGCDDSVKVRVHVMEIDHGPFAREVELPEDVVKEKIAAAYHDGLLWVELPKK